LQKSLNVMCILEDITLINPTIINMVEFAIRKFNFSHSDILALGGFAAKWSGCLKRKAPVARGGISILIYKID